VASNPIVDSGPRDTTIDPESDQQPEKTPEELRMIGDFDGSANEFWKLYKDEAKSHDDARFNSLQKGMDSAIIFVRSYSVHDGLGYTDAWSHRLGYFLLFSQHS
jgi:hypothetical protein